jgi:hypothetical protein
MPGGPSSTPKYVKRKKHGLEKNLVPYSFVEESDVVLEIVPFKRLSSTT